MLTDRYGYALTTASPHAREACVAGVDLLVSANDGAEQESWARKSLDVTMRRPHGHDGGGAVGMGGSDIVRSTD